MLSDNENHSRSVSDDIEAERFGVADVVVGKDCINSSVTLIGDSNCRLHNCKVEVFYFYYQK